MGEQLVKVGGLKFKIFGYKVRIWHTGWEYEKGGRGRYHFFYWHPYRWRKK